MWSGGFWSSLLECCCCLGTILGGSLDDSLRWKTFFLKNITFNVFCEMSLVDSIGEAFSRDSEAFWKSKGANQEAENLFNPLRYWTITALGLCRLCLKISLWFVNFGIFSHL